MDLLLHESDVILTLFAGDRDMDADALEETMFAVLAAVEQYAAEIAEGAVTAVDFAAHSIELAFSVCHETQSQANEKVTQVLAVIEQHTPVSFGSHDASVRATGDRDSSSTAVALHC